jgi:hypothetical protein
MHSEHNFLHNKIKKIPRVHITLHDVQEVGSVSKWSGTRIWKWEPLLLASDLALQISLATSTSYHGCIPISLRRM